MHSALDQAIAQTRAHLLSLRHAAGHWEGELSSSALSTATAVVALATVDEDLHRAAIEHGARWLMKHQHADGGWGDTTISKSNLSTTLLCVSALTLVDAKRACRCPDEVANQPGSALPCAAAIAQCHVWLRSQIGSLEPQNVVKAVVSRYGKDKTFSVPILMLCAICGTLGERGWRRVLPLPFELAALPRAWFGAVGLPVVSYALPALIAIGHARFHEAPPAWWNPLRWLRALLWRRIRPMLKALQPSSGGYLEATPLTSFVTMALASSGDRGHPCVPGAVAFLLRSQRADGSWPIDTNLATWGTTLSIKALGRHADQSVRTSVKEWLLRQQYREVHPFTNAAPGGWAWTDLPGGVPDADDTSGALMALWQLCDTDEERKNLQRSVEAGVTWLLDLQNRDGGMPTFCCGWGTLPFDRSTPEITAHAMCAVALWVDWVNECLQKRIHHFIERSQSYLDTRPTVDWHERVASAWVPLWFGNEHAPEEENPVFGTAQVVKSLILSGLARRDHWERYLVQEVACAFLATRSVKEGTEYLLQQQQPSGAWGGAASTPPSMEETALATEALALVYGIILDQPQWDVCRQRVRSAVERGSAWLCEATQGGTHFPPAPIGLYFARLWYHEQLYPVVWTLGALQAAKHVLDNRAALAP
ncbi:MAG: prenyltransferase/squalene oxidase repeat-containing protein [Roseimicrobium sp.]